MRNADEADHNFACPRILHRMKMHMIYGFKLLLLLPKTIIASIPLVASLHLPGPSCLDVSSDLKIHNKDSGGDGEMNRD
jgi:hypothetical protein